MVKIETISHMEHFLYVASICTVLGGLSIFLSLVEIPGSTIITFESENHSVVAYSSWPHRLCSPWNSPGHNTGVCSLSLLQGIFPTQELNLGLLHCRQILYQLSYEESNNNFSVQFFIRVQLFATPWPAALQASLSITNSQSLPKLMSIESVMPYNHLTLCHPLLLSPSIFPSIRVFSDKSVLRIRWPKYWSFSFNISPSNEHSGLISFRMNWLDVLAVQRTLKSLLQHHSL